MRLWPKFTVSSSRPAWLQVIRGLTFFSIGVIVLLAGSIGVAAAKGAWDRHQDRQRWRSELASEGIAEACHRGVDHECAQGGANKAKTEVAYIDDHYAYLWVSVGTQDYKAYEESIAGTLWSQPRLDADRSKRFHVARTVKIDGVSFTLWAYVVPQGCRCSRAESSTSVRPTTNATPHKQAIARATWKHDGQLYELATYFGDDPIAKLTQTLTTIRYVTPSG